MYHRRLLLFFSAFFLFTSLIEGQVFSHQSEKIGTTLPIITYRKMIRAIDVDQDGDRDIVHFEYRNMFWYENDGNGSFSDSIQILDGTYGFFRDFELIDIDNDNDLDLVLRASQKIIWLKNNGKFEFEFGNEISSGEIDGGFALASADLDQDGDIDIIADDYEIGNFGFIWYENDGEGNFNLKQQILDEVFLGVQQIETADIDQDGDDDVVIGTSVIPYHRLFWCENDGNGNLVLKESLGGNNHDIRVLKIIDLDQDNDLDIFTLSKENNKVVWYENYGDGNFGSSISAFGYNKEPDAAGFGDVDKDGDIDIIIGNTAWNPQMVLYQNEGDGTFSRSDTIYYNEGEIDDIDLSDLDNDGDLDLLVGYGDDLHEIRWFKNIYNTPRISGCFYHDTNNNGVKDSTDRTLNVINSSISSEAQISYTNNDGCYHHVVNDGTYNVSFVTNEHWILSSDSSSYNVNIVDKSVTGLNFGFIPLDSIILGNVNISSGIPRCFRKASFDFNFKNEGTTVLSGTYKVQYSKEYLALIESSPFPSTSGNKYWEWTFENLYPGEVTQFKTIVQMPTIGQMQSDGAKFVMTAIVDATSQGGQEQSFYYKSTFEAVCAYDPNDKLVHPDREGEENFTLLDEDLTYTIRFQNTGNDTAFSVVIRDTLDDNLDASTLRVLASSHPSHLRTELKDEQYLTFTFDNIELPDSTTNFNGSQGYVSYIISPVIGIQENTIVTNRAGIYFDFNPPIITNTTQNTFVKCLPSIASSTTIFIAEGENYILPDSSVVNAPGIYEVSLYDDENCLTEVITFTIEIGDPSSTPSISMEKNITVFPNPTKDFFTIELKEYNTKSYQLTVYNTLGQSIYQEQIQHQISKIETPNWQEGVYYLQFTSLSGEIIATKKIVKMAAH